MISIDWNSFLLMKNINKYREFSIRGYGYGLRNNDNVRVGSDTGMGHTGAGRVLI